MKVLIVSHSHISLYGAVTSLKLLLRSIDWDYDLVYPKHYRKNPSDQEIRDFFGEKTGKIIRAYLPYHSTAASSISTISRRIKDVIIRAKAFCDSFRLNREIKKGGYDYILLNSIILFSMIRKKPRYAIYLRETCKLKGLSRKWLVHKLNQADKVIMIDPVIIRALKGLNTEYRVINNPFDMTGMKTLIRSEMVRKHPEISTEKIVILIAGAVNESKGVLFAIEAFNQIERKDIQLVIAGEGMHDYMSKCRNLARNNPDIIFIGDQPRIEEIYFLTDYLLRADLYFATGRTVYEALYSGCSVIMQADNAKDSEWFQEYDQFRDHIFFYKTRDPDSLKNVFRSLPLEKVSERIYRSNTEQYITEIKSFLN